MPKFKIVCFILAAVMAAVGTVMVVRNLSNEFVPPDKVLTDLDPNTYLDKTEDMDISDRTRDVREFLFVAHKILLEGSGFKGVSTGKSTAVGGIEQSVLNTRVVLGEFGNKRVLKEMVTKGIVSNAYQLYLVGTGEEGNYIYRGFDRVRDLNDVEWSKVAQPLSMQAFYNKFGHRSDKLTSYILNWDTVLSGEFVSEEDGEYTFRYVLDTETAPADLRYEMITNGGLDDFPVFSKCEIYVTMDAEFNVKSLRTDCAYKATTMGINAGCTEDITEVFEPYEGKLDLPYTEFFEPYLGKTGGDIVTEPTPLEMLMQMFSPYLNGVDLQAKLSVNDGEEIASALLSVSGLDISDLSKLAVDLNVGEFHARYENSAGKLLMKYKDFLGSTTVQGLTELAGPFSWLTDADKQLDMPEGMPDMSGLEDFDVNSLLDGLTYALSEDNSVCTVSLPISIGGIYVDAKLVGDLRDDGYQFDYADINVGEINVHISPESWTPVVIDGNAPEILGIADLLNNGKLSLQADATLPLFGVDYAVKADVLADLGKLAVKANAALGNNGTAELCYADGVIYVTFGSLRFKLDTSRAESVEELVKQLVGEAQTNDFAEVGAEDILALLGGIEATTTDDGAAFRLASDDIELTINLTDSNDRWNVKSISFVGYGLTATIAPSDAYGEVTIPDYADSYADVTELVDTFAQPVTELLNGTSYGADFDVVVSLATETYDVAGSFELDEKGNIHVKATVYNRGVGIVDADVTVVDDVVYLTVDGVRAAFNIGDTGATDIAALQSLADNEQLSALLGENENVKQLAEAIAGAAEVFESFSLDDLLDLDITRIIKYFAFERGRLTINADCSPLGLDMYVSTALYVDSGDLCVELGGRINDLTLDVNAELRTGVEAITAPDPDDYLLSLHGEAMGAEIDVTADFVNMDIWASAHFGNEELLLRFVGGKLYVVYGGAKVALDVADIDGIVQKLETLADGGGILPSEASDLIAIFAALSADLTGAEPNISFDYGDVFARVRFVNVNDKLVFEGIEADITVQDKQFNVTLTKQSATATKTETDGEFVDGNALVSKLLDAAIAFKNVDSVALKASFDVTLGDESYLLTADVNLNGGVYARVILRDGTGLALVSAQICYADNVLYLDVNGIRQAVELSDIGGEKVDLGKVLGVLKELKGKNDVLDSVIDAIEKMPDDLGSITFANVLKSLDFDGETVAVGLALDQFGLGGVTLRLSLDDDITLDAQGVVIGKAALNANVSVAPSDTPVVAPNKADYVTGIVADLGNGMSVLARVDLFEKRVDGKLILNDKNFALFSYEQGVVYIQFGNLSAKLALADASRLMDAIGKFVALPELPQGDAADIVSKALDMLGYSRNATEDGYSIDLALDGAELTVYFACTEDKAALSCVEIALDNETFSRLTLRVDDEVRFETVDMGREFADITEIADTFADPVAKLIGGGNYGANFDVNVTLGGTNYLVGGSFALDQNNNFKLNATIFEGNVGIINADVIVADGGVYLTVNGVKVAFKLNGGNANADLGEAIDELLANEQIETLLGEHKDLEQLVAKLKDIVEAFTALDINDVDFAEILRSVRFDGGELSLNVNASAFGLGDFTVVLGVDCGNLAVALKDFTLESVYVKALSATVLTDTDSVVAPSPADYVLNLKAVGAGITADISADLYNMDIWANIRYRNDGIKGLPVDEKAQLRFVNNNLYVKLNNIALVFDAANVGDIVQRLLAVIGLGEQSGSLDVNELLSELVFDLAGAHRIGFASDIADVSVNFACENNALIFSDITVSAGDALVKVTLGDTAAKMSTSGVFADGNKLADKIVSLVERFKDAQGVEIDNLTANVNIDKNVYKAVVSLRYDNGIEAELKLYDKADVLLVNAQITVADNVLYLSANGIKQKIALPESVSDGEKTDLDEIFAMFDELKGVNDVLDGVIDAVKALPNNLASLRTVSDVVKSFAFEGEKIVLKLSDALGIGDVTIGIDADNCALTLDGLALGGISLDVESVRVDKYNEVVLAPTDDFTTELNVDLGKFGNAAVKLDLFEGVVNGFVKLFGKDCNRIDLLYSDGTVYLDLGEKVGAYLNVADIDALMSALSPFVTTPSTELSAKEIAAKVFEILSDVERDVTGGGYSLKINLNDTAIAVSFDKQAQLLDLTVALDGTALVVTPTSGNKFADVNTDKAQSANITSLAQAFVPAIDSLINGNGCKVDGFDADIAFNGKTLTLSGSFAIDSDGHIQVKAAVKDGATTIVNADVVIADGVYLTVNGINVAFKTGGAQDSETDLSAALDKLQNSQELRDALSDYPELLGLIDELCGIVQNLAEFDVTSLDLSKLLQEMSYDDGSKRLSLTVNASDFGLGSKLNLTLSASGDKLSIEQFNGLAVKSLAVTNLCATVETYDEAIAIPDPADYILYLHVTGAGIAADVSADLYNMEFLAQVTYGHEAVQGVKIDETALIRFADNKLYLQAGKDGQIALMFQADGIAEAIGKIVALVSDTNTSDTKFDVKGLLSKLSFDLTGEKPAIEFLSDGAEISLNFTNTDGVLSFGSLTATFGDFALTAVTQTKTDIERPSENDDDYADGNKLFNVLYNVLEAAQIKSIVNDKAGVNASLGLVLALGGKHYAIDAEIWFNTDLKVTFTVSDKADGKPDLPLIQGEVVLASESDGKVLYLDVNGIKQAINLAPASGDKGEFRLDDLTDALESYRGIHAAADAVIDFVQGLPDKLVSLRTVSDLVGGISLYDDNNILLTVAGSKLGLASDVTFTVGVDDNKRAKLAASEIALGNDGSGAQTIAASSLSACIVAYTGSIEAPSGDYRTDLNIGLTFGADDAQKLSVNVQLRIDLYNERIYGKASFKENTASFEIKSGKLFVKSGETKLMLDLKNDIDKIKTSLAQLGVTMPEFDLGGSVAGTIKSLFDSLGYARTDNGYCLDLTFGELTVKADFNVGDDENVSLGSLTVEGGSFEATAKQQAIGADVNGLPDAKEGDYFDAADALGDLAPAIGALMKASGYSVKLDSVTLTLGENVYKITATVTTLGSDAYIEIESIHYNGKTLVESGNLWLYGGKLYVNVGGIKLRVALDGAKDDPEATALEDIDGTLDGLKGYNTYLDDLLELVRAVAHTDLLSLDVTNIVGVKRSGNGLQLSVNEGALTLKVDGSDWTVPEITATVQPTSDNNGLTLVLNGFAYKNIALEINKLTVSANDGFVAPSDDEDWTTNLDISVNDDSGVTNTVHVRVDLDKKVVYVRIDSQDERSEATDKAKYNLFVKYDIGLNKLWISNHENARTSVNISEIGKLVNEVQKIVNRVAKEGNNFDLPNLFGDGFDLAEILRSLRFVHGEKGVGVTLNAMGFGVEALLSNSKLTADIDISSIFDGTTLTLKDGVADAHSDFAKEIDEDITKNGDSYVSLDGVLDDLFYGRTDGKLNTTESGVIYDLVNTNAWRFDFTDNKEPETTSEINITSKNEQGVSVTDSYRIQSGSYIAFYFNKSDTVFSMNTLIDTFKKDKQEGYAMLFDLLNSLQLRAKFTLLKKANGESNYNEMVILDVALLRTQQTVYEGNKMTVKPKSRLYVSYDTSSNRDGVLRATLNLDSLQDVIGLKDALDSVLNGAIGKLVDSIQSMISEAQSNMPKLQLGRVARLIKSVSYGGYPNNFDIALRGSAFSDKLGDINLDVQPCINNTDNGNPVGNGLLVNNLKLSYDGISINLNNVSVSASPFHGDKGEDSTADTRTYDYVDQCINAYLADNDTNGDATGSPSTAENFNKYNVSGHNMGNHMDFDSIYELLASVTITAANYEDYTPAENAPPATQPGRRSFKIDGTLKLSITVGDLNVKEVSIPIWFYADIDEYGDSYFALKIHRSRETAIGFDLFADYGGNSYLLYNTVDKEFTVARDSIISHQWCSKCNDYSCSRPFLHTAWHHNDEVYDSTYSKYVKGNRLNQSTEPTSGGKVSYKDEHISPTEFMANLLGGERNARGYLFEMINLGKINLLVTKIDLEQTIKDAMNKPAKEFGIEDVLDQGKSYNYGTSSTGDKQFEIIANLNAISDGLQTLTINIHHSGDFKLTRLEGNVDMASGYVHIDFDLYHTTPSYGNAYDYAMNQNMWW